MSKEWPRRRDVREMLLMIHHLLDRKASYDELAEAFSEQGEELIVSDDFDRDFLTEVRDLVRDGTCLADALLAIASAEDVAIPVETSPLVIAPPPHIGDRQAFFAGVAAASQNAGDEGLTHFDYNGTPVGTATANLTVAGLRQARDQLRKNITF